MNIRSVTWMAALLAASLATTATAQPKAKVVAVPSKVAAGHGWAKDPMNDQWIWANESTEPSTTKLVTEPGARGILAVKLPDGATHAALIWVYVTYAAPGEGTWSLYTTAKDGAPAGKPLWTADVSITDKQVTAIGQPSSYTKETQLDFGDAATDLTGPFYLVFETRSGQPAIAAMAGASNVSYQPKGKPAKAVAFKPFIRVVVGDVK